MAELATRSELCFVVLGRPQGKGSKRVLPIRGRNAVGERQVALVDSNRNAAPWALKVAAAAADGLIEYEGARPYGLIRGPVLVRLDFYFSRPRSHFGTGRNHGRLKPSAPVQMDKMPDVDKLARCALDALVGVVIADDAQVSRLEADKRWGEPERLEGRVIVL